jgi:hypothetical protein
MGVANPVELVQRADHLMQQGQWSDAEVLLIEAWRLAQQTTDHALRGDVAFRIAATYRLGGRDERARHFDLQAFRFQQSAFGLD